jgi:hypothetical protein
VPTKQLGLATQSTKLRTNLNWVNRETKYVYEGNFISQSKCICLFGGVA